MGNAELQLIIDACRACFSDAQPLAALPEGVDWRRVVDLTHRHRVQALCWKGLSPFADQIPQEAAAQLRSQAAAVVASNLRIGAECNRLLGLFDGNDVDLLFLKGLALAALAYPDPYLKMGWDIDLLVSREQAADAFNQLRSAGYAPLTPGKASDAQLLAWHRTHKESVWHCADGDFYVELHTRLSDNPAMLPGVGMNSHRQVARMSAGLELPTLGPEELFAYLAVHGASSAWFRLKWAADLAALLSFKTSAEIESLYERALQLGAGRSAAQALLLVEQLFGVQLGHELKLRLEAGALNCWLVKIALTQIGAPAEPTQRPLGTATIHLSQLGLKAGWGFVLSESIRQAREILSRAAHSSDDQVADRT